MRGDYRNGSEGGAPVAVRMEARGRLEPSGYSAFVRERMDWLGLVGRVEASGPAFVRLVAAGPEALVGALEMACILGPGEMVVETLHVSRIAAPAEAGPPQK